MNNFPTPEKAGPPPISAGELCELRNRELAIQSGLNRFFEIGEHLYFIRERRLYRAEYGSFEQYCEERWDMSARYARRLCAAAQVTRLLSVASGAAAVLPATESQARPLTTLPTQDVIQIWAEVLRTAPAGKVTAKHVESVVDRHHRKNIEPLPILTPTTPKIERPFQPAIVSDRQNELQRQCSNAIAGVLDLVDAIGTADSAATGKVLEALHKLEDFQIHLRRVDDLKARRQ